jgi:UDP-2,3-diacylglucosamine pyrophosphatase LpxH
MESEKKTHYDVVVISDVHIGMKDCKVQKLNKFLKSINCNKLILNGDIIDTFAIKKKDRLHPDCLKFFRIIMKKMMKEDCEVIYIRGNHDDFLHHFVNLGVRFKNFSIREEYILNIDNKSYYITHGDIFDKHIPAFLYVIGSWFYDLILWINRNYNHWREKRGKPYFSLAYEIKKNSKFVTNFFQKFQKQLKAVAEAKHVDGVITGHIHNPEIKNMEKFTYLNSGDWIENCSALVYKDGKWKLINK